MGIDDQTVHEAQHACKAQGLKSLVKGSSRPERTRLVFGPEQAERLRALMHRNPRDFHKPTSVWTLDLGAEASVAEGLVATPVRREPMRHTVVRLGLTRDRR